MAESNTTPHPIGDLNYLLYVIEHSYFLACKGEQVAPGTFQATFTANLQVHNCPEILLPTPSQEVLGNLSEYVFNYRSTLSNSHPIGDLNYLLRSIESSYLMACKGELVVPGIFQATFTANLQAHGLPEILLPTPPQEVLGNLSKFIITYRDTLFRNNL